MRQIAFVGPGEEGDAAWRWLAGLRELDAHCYASLARVPWPAVELVWAHGAVAPEPALVDWITAGGRLLCTGAAALIPANLGLESVAPDERRAGVWRHADDEFWLPEYRSFLAFSHIRGLAGFGAHPLFDGLHQGTYSWAPSEDEHFDWVTYAKVRPAAGRVVGVERSFIHLNAERVVAWEQGVGQGGILCIGAYTHFNAPDPLLARQLQALISNAVLGDAIPHRRRTALTATWPAPGVRARADDLLPPPLLPDLSGAWQSSEGPAIESAAAADEPWTLAGRRVFLVGGERSGLREVWVHPHRVVREVGMTIDGTPPIPAAVRVAPDEIVRTLGGGVTERWTTALEHPLVIWEVEAPAAALVAINFTTDLRLMWPYPAAALGDLRFNVDADRTRGWIGVEGAPAQLVIGVVGGAIALTAGADASVRVSIEGRGPLRVSLVGATDDADLERTLRVLEQKRFEGVQSQRRQHVKQVSGYGAHLATGDPALDRAFEWSKLRMDSFLAGTPGVGRSLVAGYGGSAPGWADGRPGYAWYFGRDACWTGFALLAAGLREPVRDTLKFLSATQDVSGKILHEYTTSGLAHYDAADSTPLYLLLAGRYAAWTGDLPFLERWWESIAKAYRFAVETDTDGDGLIENHRVGHGWIEHGPLGGSAVTLYTNACWVAALEALEPAAEALGHTKLATEMGERARKGRDAARKKLRVDGEWALGLRADGTVERHRTAMLSVPLLLGLVPPAEASAWYDAVAGEAFSAPWGVRMIPADDPLFDPAGYHLGAVWPLYTGWVSLSEWRGERMRAALDHLRSNAALCGERAKGAFDEVLHGLERKSAGICPDQAWSAGMVALPVIEGLWGVTPRALDGAVTLEPWLPPEWKEMSLDRLRVGTSVLDLRVRRRSGQLVIQCRRTHGERIHVELSPRGLGPVHAITIDGTELPGGPRAAFEADGEHEVVFFER
ncbi:MAG: GH116 family glycosyl hydrolase [Gemmatimonadales bacterium]